MLDNPLKRKWSKGRLACEFCRNRKSRCQYAPERVGEGCERCREFGMRCSLSTVMQPTGGATAVWKDLASDANAGAPQTSLLNSLHAKLSEMNSLLQQHAREIHLWSNPPVASSDAARDEIASRNGDEQVRPIDPMLFVVQQLGIPTRTRFLDPIELGVVTKPDVVSAWNKLTTRMDDLCPLSTLSKPSDEPWSSFLVSCVLYMTRIGMDPTTADRICHILRANLSRLERCSASFDALLGLFLLSYAPIEYETRYICIVEPHAAAVQAYSMAVRLGLEDEALALEQNPSSGREWTEERLARIMLVSSASIKSA